jgi:hypothetical protein
MFSTTPKHGTERLANRATRDQRKEDNDNCGYGDDDGDAHMRNACASSAEAASVVCVLHTLCTVCCVIHSVYTHTHTHTSRYSLQQKELWDHRVILVEDQKTFVSSTEGFLSKIASSSLPSFCSSPCKLSENQFTIEFISLLGPRCPTGRGELKRTVCVCVCVVVPAKRRRSPPHPSGSGRSIGYEWARH